jgi:hypothetical protein
MSQKNQRSYAKESYKSSPTGIRFNLEQERIALMRSKCKTRQKLVDFLLENYVRGDNWVTKENISATDVPTTMVTKQEITQTPTVLSQGGKSVEQHYKEIKNLETPYEYEQKEKEIKKDESLSSKERTDLLLFIKLPKG